MRSLTMTTQACTDALEHFSAELRRMQAEIHKLEQESTFFRRLLRLIEEKSEPCEEPPGTTE